MHIRVLPLLLLLLVPGCGDTTHGRVSGKVTKDGRPLPNVMVGFSPISKELNPGPGSVGKTNEQGEYSLEVVGGGSGAVLGWHKVTIHPAGGAPYTLKGDGKFEVKRGENAADFEVLK
jgi:hypothetical protein